jgi:hypothetical protein
MSGQIERVEPIVVNGIEFYVSNSGDESGISITGLSIVCGVGYSTITSLINGLSDHDKSTYKELEHLRGKTLALTISSNQQAKVIKDEYAADIISYYAAKGNTVAKESLRKFQTIGIRTWIKEVTGASTGADFSLVQKILNQLLEGQAIANASHAITNARLLSLEQKTNGYTKASIEMPGLEKWLTAYGEEETEQLALPDGELVTLSEYLWNEKRLKFDKKSMGIFANKVSFVYRTMAEERPEKKRGVTIKGYQTPMTNAYRRRDYPLLDIAFKQTVLEL